MSKNYYGPFTTRETSIIMHALEHFSGMLKNEVCPGYEKENPEGHRVNVKWLQDTNALRARIQHKLDTGTACISGTKPKS